jgi:hypothetical protein
MSAAKVFVVRNTTIDTVIKIVADSTNTNTTTFLPASGFILTSGQTQTLPVTLGIKGVVGNAPGGITIYRGTGQTTAATDVVLAGSGNISFDPVHGFYADYDSVGGDFTITMGTYGTVYLHLSKMSGYTSTFTPEQSGHLAG